MATDSGSVSDLAERVRAALDAADLAAFRELLAPDAKWGPPDDPGWGCHNRDQVLAWYQRSRDEGMTAAVTEVVVGRGALLVGLKVAGTAAAMEQGGEAERWQVLTVRGGRIADIRGFDHRDEAAARAGVTP
jgi:ketosteroid isomerase-like protein